VALLILPVMPAAAQALWEQLGLTGQLGEMSGDELEESLGFRPGPDQPTVSPGVTAFPRPAAGLGAGAPLFPRLDRKKALARLAGEEAPAGGGKKAGERKAKGEKKEKAVSENDSTKESGLISIDDFMGVELRTARVLECEKVEGADKLLRLVVDIGTERRQLVAGIAKVYPPEEMIGKSIVVVANLKPAKLRGIESQGMLLAADSGDGPRVVEVPESVAPGTLVR
jgi:methionyl-tRNA synthetase